MARRLNGRAVFVINQAPSRRRGKEPTCIDRAIETLHAYGLPIAPAGLRSRAVYQSALGRGLTAQEAEPRSAAAAEVRALWRYAARELWKPAALPSAPARRPALVSPVRLAPVTELRPAG
jgi:chromosome partitioning protein